MQATRASARSSTVRSSEKIARVIQTNAAKKAATVSRKTAKETKAKTKAPNPIEAMAAAQVVKHSFESGESANAVKETNIRLENFCLALSKADGDFFQVEIGFKKTKVVRFIFCNKQEYKKLCMAGYNSRVYENVTEKENKTTAMKTVFQMKTFQGAVLDECFHDGRYLFGCIVDDGNLLQTVQTVFFHLLHIFPTRAHNHVRIDADSFSSASWVFGTGAKLEVYGLTVTGNWKVKDFETVIGSSEFKVLTLKGNPPTNCQLKRITADKIHLHLENEWLTERTMLTLDAKEISIHQGDADFCHGLVHEQYNTILKIWSQKRGFVRLESLELKLQHGALIHQSMIHNGLNKRKWDKKSRPAYTTVSLPGSSSDMQVWSIEAAEDVMRIDGVRGTVVWEGYERVHFVAWVHKRNFYSNRDFEKIESYKRSFDKSIQNLRTEVVKEEQKLAAMRKQCIDWTNQRKIKSEEGKELCQKFQSQQDKVCEVKSRIDKYVMKKKKMDENMEQIKKAEGLV